MALRRQRFIGTEDSVVVVDQNTTIGATQFAKKAIETPMHTILCILHMERCENFLYDEIWKRAEARFERKKQILLNQSAKPMPRECHIAIIAYTMDDVINGVALYYDFNRKCRESFSSGGWETFKYQSFYCLLAHCIPGVDNVPGLNNKIYRGVNFHYSQATLRKGYLAFNQFVSCSTNLMVAEHFKNGPGTIIEFTQIRDNEGCGIAYYSDYFYEQEVLIFPFIVYKIVKFDTSGSEHKITLGGSVSGPPCGHHHPVVFF